MVNIVALLFSATNEETPYEQLLLGIRDVARGFFFLRNGYATDTVVRPHAIENLWFSG